MVMTQVRIRAAPATSAVASPPWIFRAIMAMMMAAKVIVTTMASTLARTGRVISEAAYSEEISACPAPAFFFISRFIMKKETAATVTDMTAQRGTEAEMTEVTGMEALAAVIAGAPWMK